MYKIRVFHFSAFSALDHTRFSAPSYAEASVAESVAIPTFHGPLVAKKTFRTREIQAPKRLARSFKYFRRAKVPRGRRVTIGKR